MIFFFFFAGRKAKLHILRKESMTGFSHQGKCASMQISKYAEMNN
jgi:hypothetical protein